MNIGPIHGRILVAALDFCKEEAGLTAERRRARANRCELRNDPKFFGLCPGCANCLAFDAAQDGYKGSLKRRYQAKRRMMTAFKRFTQETGQAL